MYSTGASLGKQRFEVLGRQPSQVADPTCSVPAFIPLGRGSWSLRGFPLVSQPFRSEETSICQDLLAFHLLVLALTSTLASRKTIWGDLLWTVWRTVGVFLLYLGPPN